MKKIIKKYTISFFIIIILYSLAFGTAGEFIAHMFNYSSRHLIKSYNWVYRCQFPCVMNQYGGCITHSLTEKLAKHRGSFICRCHSIPLEYVTDSVQISIPELEGFIEYVQVLSPTKDSLVNNTNYYILTFRVGRKNYRREKRNQWRMNSPIGRGSPFYVEGTLFSNTEVDMKNDTLLFPVFDYHRIHKIGTMTVIKDKE